MICQRRGKVSPSLSSSSSLLFKIGLIGILGTTSWMPQACVAFSMNGGGMQLEPSVSLGSTRSIRRLPFTSKMVYSSSSSSILGRKSCTPSSPCRRPLHTSSARSSTLSMHMGHSHSHHHHHDHNDNDNEVASGGRKRLAIHKRRRKIALFVFAAMAILGPPLARTRTLGRADVAAFVVTSTCLTFFDAVRKEVKYAINKIKNFKDGILKHSTPITAKYFFRNENAADRVTLLGGIINLVLSLGKFVVGVTCHSSALIADAGHSLSDLFSDFITLWAVQIGRLPPDDDHPYGHGKFEAVGSLFLALTLLGTGIAVGAESNRRLIEILSVQTKYGFAAAQTLAGKMPTFPALLMAGLSIVSKEWLYRITRNVGEEINSQVVIANAWHHRSDAYSSILALVSIGLAMFVPGLLAADSAAGIMVAGMICMTGAEIMSESIKQLTDTNNEDLVQKVTKLAANTEDVREVTRVRARQVGSSAIVDVEVSMDVDLASSAARAIEERIKSRIMSETNGDVMDADVHAKSPPEVIFCPLLEATNIQPSAAEVESCVRDEILKKHPEVSSVEGVTVHFEDTLLVNVDVDIRMDDSTTPNTPISKVATLARDVRKSLEASASISKANIFLDLNSAEGKKSSVIPTTIL
mmetsp:Transcript_14893/g.21059  ORF Transcript_14893/g.21059 Transcript_14893/m.21059 type:complete len:638 (+) Transcript_14893:168-2081(+)